jgi:hypothetical protein
MKTTTKFTGLMLFALALVICGCQKQSGPSLWPSINDPALADQLKSFISEKQAQADAAGGKTLPGFSSFMAAAQRGDRAAVKKLGRQIEHQSQDDPHLHTARVQTVNEIIGTFDAFGDGNAKYSALYGNEIIESIPPGSIYFGGTDPGRFVITAMQKSLVKGDPFFTLTQNALADGTYLDYLRSMYGSEIYIPTADDSQKCFNDYYDDVQKRMKLDKLQPGENASVDPASGKMQVSGQVAVMNINALIVKVIFDHETNRDFYVEESFPLAWMYPYLEPHGLIFKLNHQPLSTLPDETVRQDHDYWSKTVSPMIGDWLNDDTSVSDVAAFSEKVFLRHDFSGFTGDTNFVLDSYAHKTFSKERSSSAGMYAWRAQNATDPGEKERMNNAADFAFRQSWALCPYSPEAVFRYVAFLMGENRSSDALLVAETAAKFSGTDGAPNESIKDLIAQLKRYQKQ